jgi:membrane protease subunit HflC
LLSPERGEVMDNIQNALQRLASQYGVEIVDVRIKQTDLPSGSPLDSALNRMATARGRKRLTIRAQGLKEATDHPGQAQAQAAQVYAQAFNKDPAFYDFYRAMQSYRRRSSPTARARAIDRRSCSIQEQLSARVHGPQR